jgi:hypothetical protein
MLNLFFQLTDLTGQILVKVIVESWFAAKYLGFIVFRSFKDSYLEIYSSPNLDAIYTVKCFNYSVCFIFY